MNAICLHCGWKGEIRSRDFERAYGSARCHASVTGKHHVIPKLTTTESEMQIDFFCTLCGAVGLTAIDPIESVEWTGRPSVKNPVVDSSETSDESPQENGKK